KRNLVRRCLEDRGRTDVGDRFLRSRTESGVLGSGESEPRLERRRAPRRQFVYVLGAGARCGNRQTALAFPIHAARHARLGCQPNFCAVRCAGWRAHAQTDRQREPQRVLLRAGPNHGRIHCRASIRETDLRAPDSEPSEEGSLVWPNLNGGTVWFSPSYDPQTKLFYVAAREIGAKYFKREAEYKAGTFYAGGGEDELPADDAWGAIRALDPITGAQRWEFKLHSPPWAGVLSTAGGVVFSGSDEGNFYALDARTGKFLWQF